MTRKDRTAPGKPAEAPDAPPGECATGEGPGQGTAPGPAQGPAPGPEEAAFLQAELAALRDRHLRLSADFDNHRKRTAREREETVCFANESLIGDLLPVLDNLERALATAEGCAGAGSIAEGIRLIHRQIEEVLGRCGLSHLAAAGVPFDPNLHEAVGVVPSGEHPEGTVVSEVRRGFTLKGKVIRPAMVLVSRGSSSG
jgi:molecular chaperone GrpE